LDELTLFELHRRPRPLLTGRIQRSLKALNAEFRCAICLDYIRSTRTVVECLHRFCEGWYLPDVSLVVGSERFLTFRSVCLCRLY
jgi:hypothetical protein